MTDPAPTERFADRSSDYARYRPTYPAAAVDAVLCGLPPPFRMHAADVAAGTGIFARLLAERGVPTTAVEPNASMRAAAAPHPLVRWVDGTAEATTLPAASADLLTAAQAFHWFDAAAALAEFARVLRASGRLAIVWNRRCRDDAFTLGYCQALEAIDGEAPAERSTFDPSIVGATRLFTAYEAATFPLRQAITGDELIGRARSTSTVPKSGPRWDELVRLLTALHARCCDSSGRATFVYRTEVFRWRRGPAAAC